MEADAPAEMTANDGGAVFHSRLRAKREERQQQRLQSQHAASGETTATSPDGIVSPARVIGDQNGALVATVNGVLEQPLALHEVPHHHRGRHTQRDTSRSTGRSVADDARRRQRAEARRQLIEYTGSVWDAVRANDVATLRCFFVVEGAARLLQLHCKEPAERSRTLLHVAAWWGQADVAAFLVDAGATVDAIDTVASRTTPLMDAARAGHGDVCVLLLRHGADATQQDNAGDTAFHWAARRKHGAVLLAMARALESLDARTAQAVWTVKNGQGKTPMDYARTHATIFPMLQRRLGARIPAISADVVPKRRSRVPATTADSMVTPDSAAALETRRGSWSDARPVSSRETSQPLRDVQSLGLDVETFSYRPRDVEMTVAAD
ncbi:hypothetical protein P43SY_004092 [Pythium insidiosum]|uniref:Uncharacterized protein n=1 Tax=Pythium insidiosum TaxID=114742 RepID=A0AAD5LHE4_PYTIN|nr:hypothetical protein P43SY_004092 [Pythium insidiosum]